MELAGAGPIDGGSQYSRTHPDSTRIWRSSAAARRLSGALSPAGKPRRKPSSLAERRIGLAGREAQGPARSARRKSQAGEESPEQPHRADLAASQYAVGQVLGDLDRFDEAIKTLKKRWPSARPWSMRARERRSQLDVGWTHLASGHDPLESLPARTGRARMESGLDAMESALRGRARNSAGWHELDRAWVDVADKLVQIGLLGRNTRTPGSVRETRPALADRDGHYWYVLAVLKLLSGNLKGYRPVSFAEFLSSLDGNTNSTFSGHSDFWGHCDPADAKALVPAVDAESWLAIPATSNCDIVQAAMIHLRAGDLNQASARS